MNPNEQPAQSPQQQPSVEPPASPQSQPQPIIPTPEQLNAAQQQTQPPQQPVATQPEFQPPQAAPQPQMVYMARPVSPEDPHISEEVKAKHVASVRKYPSLNLSEGEYIISAVRRHPIGMVPIFGIVGVVLLALGAGVPIYETMRESAGNLPPTGIVAILAFLFSILTVIGGYVAVYIYVNNKFFLTNESVIQEIQHSLFSKHEQTVSLANIEDASFVQNGLIPHLFNYGSIRLSTEGDETTYRFSYVTNPKKQIATLNNAVEAFKNGRPVSED